MNIHIVCIGSIKEEYLKAAIKEYEKRLSRYVKIDIIELKDEKTIDGATQAASDKIKRMEGERIRKALTDGAYTIALDIKGQMLSSEKLAEHMQKWETASHSNLYFIIGGSIGLSDEILDASDYRLSFSPMTFPHQLMRVILLEQIYRSYKIRMGEPYHK